MKNSKKNSKNISTNKKAQVQQIDWIFAFLIFILFITTAVMVIKYIGDKPEIKINKDYNLVNQFFADTTVNLNVQPYILSGDKYFTNELVEIPLNNSNITVDDKYWEVLNNTLYTIVNISKRKIIKVTQLPFFPGNNTYTPDFSCIKNNCIKPINKINYFFKENILNSVFFKNDEMIHSIKYVEDKFPLQIWNQSTISGTLFSKLVAENPIIKITNEIYDLNPRIFLYFNKINANIPYTTIDINMSLPSYYSFSSYNYFLKEIDYRYAEIFNKTWCITDKTTTVQLAKNNSDKRLILAFSNPAEISICTDGTNLSMNIEEVIKNSFNMSILPTDSKTAYEIWKNVEITKGMSHNINVILNSKLNKEYTKNNLQSKELFDVIISNMNGTILHSFNSTYSGESRSFPQIKQLLMNNQSLENVIVYFVFWGSQG